MPDGLSPSVRAWTEAGQVVVYDTLTGRFVRLDPEAWATFLAAPGADASRGLRLRLERTGLLGTPARESWFPARGGGVLLLPDGPALWAPDPARPGPGGHAYRELPLDAAGVALWRGIDGRRDLATVAKQARVPLDDALARVATWTAPEVQVVQLRPRPVSPRDPALSQLAGPPTPGGPRTADQHDRDGVTDLRAYHLDATIGAATRFDDVETTVASTLADGHPALDGQPYGARLRARLAARGWPVDGPVVEVGCGDGRLARAWGPTRGPYVRVDLSPPLLVDQARAAPFTAGVLADALALPLRDGSVPLLISNEVLADLPAAPTALRLPEVEALRARYGLPRSPDGSFDNVGAWRFVAEVARVLAPGGVAALTEFGDLDAPPEEAVQLDHPEVSIRFDHLLAVARGCGLQADLCRLDELLALRLDAPQLSRESWRAVRALAHARGHRLPARAWTAATVPLPWPVEGLRDGTMAEPGPGPLVTRFQALLLRRPEAG